MMLLKWCTQYVSKFRKLSSVVAGEEKVSFHSNSKEAISENVQTPIQLCSYHIQARFCSKSFKLSFSRTQSKNFQIYKLGFRKVTEPDIKLPTFVGSWIKQGSSRKTSTSASLTMLKPFCESQQTVENLEMGVKDHLTCLQRNLYAGP